MSNEERDKPEKLRDESRRRRISRGTGLTLYFIQFVLNVERRMKQNMKSIPKNEIKILLGLSNMTPNSQSFKHYCSNIENKFGVGNIAGMLAQEMRHKK